MSEPIVLKIKLKSLVISLTVIVFIVSPFLLVLPAYQDAVRYTKSVELVHSADNARKAIETALVNNMNLDAESVLKNVSSSKYLTYSQLTNENNILLFSQELGALFILKPTEVNGKYEWRVDCYPKQGWGVLCRDAL